MRQHILLYRARQLQFAFEPFLLHNLYLSRFDLFDFVPQRVNQVCALDCRGARVRR